MSLGIRLFERLFLSLMYQGLLGKLRAEGVVVGGFRELRLLVTICGQPDQAGRINTSNTLAFAAGKNDKRHRCDLPIACRNLVGGRTALT
jgi:hypothetical protein